MAKAAYVPLAAGVKPSLEPIGKLALTREYELCVARASKYVDKASPIPATKNLVGALATTFVSTITTLGLCLK